MIALHLFQVVFFLPWQLTIRFLCFCFVQSTETNLTQMPIFENSKSSAKSLPTCSEDCPSVGVCVFQIFRHQQSLNCRFLLGEPIFLQTGNEGFQCLAWAGYGKFGRLTSTAVEHYFTLVGYYFHLHDEILPSYVGIYSTSYYLNLCNIFFLLS